MIDERLLLEALSTFNDKEHGNKHFLNGIATAKEIIESQPKVGEWIPFVIEYDEKIHNYLLSGHLPDVDEEILVSDDSDVWEDTFIEFDGMYGLDSNFNLEGLAWMPKPKPYKKVEPYKEGDTDE